MSLPVTLYLAGNLIALPFFHKFISGEINSLHEVDILLHIKMLGVLLSHFLVLYLIAKMRTKYKDETVNLDKTEIVK